MRRSGHVQSAEEGKIGGEEEHNQASRRDRADDLASARARDKSQRSNQWFDSLAWRVRNRGKTIEDASEVGQAEGGPPPVTSAVPSSVDASCEPAADDFYRRRGDQRADVTMVYGGDFDMEAVSFFYKVFDKCTLENELSEDSTRGVTVRIGLKMAA